MSMNILGIKELQTSLKRVADAVARGESFTVVRGSKPAFLISPIVEPKRTGTWADMLAAASFKGEPDLSQKIDEIVYGDSR